MPASTFGSRSPSIKAAIISRPETPKMLLAPTDSLTWASSSSFSTRCFSAFCTPTSPPAGWLYFSTSEKSTGNALMG